MGCKNESFLHPIVLFIDIVSLTLKCEITAPDRAYRIADISHATAYLY